VIHLQGGVLGPVQTVCIVSSEIVASHEQLTRESKTVINNKMLKLSVLINMDQFHIADIILIEQHNFLQLG